MGIRITNKSGDEIQLLCIGCQERPATRVIKVKYEEHPEFGGKMIESCYYCNDCYPEEGEVIELDTQG